MGWGKNPKRQGKHIFFGARAIKLVELNGIDTFCTRLCENETNLKIIQEIMGHADISTTMNIYNEATKEKKIESFANLEGKIKIS